MARKKMGSEIKSFRDFPEGVEGIIGELTQLVDFSGEPILSKAYDTPLFTLEMANKETGEVTKFWADGGLRGALKLNKVKPGMAVAIVHTGETTFELESGKKAKVQSYDLFELV